MYRATTVACVLLAALPALAQDALQDWELIRDARAKAVLAHTSYDNGLTIALRCVDGGYEALLAGLPAQSSRTQSRPIGIAFGDNEMDMQRWSIATNETIAVGETPAPFARKLREGGRLQVLVPDGAGEGRNLRYDLTLPASSASIDATLTACERPLVDPRDAELEAIPDDGLPGGFTWATLPRGEYPSSSRYARGFAVITCMTSPNGQLRDCMVESEHPHDGKFGDAAMRAVRRARVAGPEGAGAPVPPGMVKFRQVFTLAGYETPEERERIRTQPREPFGRGDTMRE
jgi:TonB family protein